MYARRFSEGNNLKPHLRIEQKPRRLKIYASYSDNIEKKKKTNPTRHTRAHAAVLAVGSTVAYSLVH